MGIPQNKNEEHEAAKTQLTNIRVTLSYREKTTIRHGESGNDENHRIRAGPTKWRSASGVLRGFTIELKKIEAKFNRLL